MRHSQSLLPGFLACALGLGVVLEPRTLGAYAEVGVLGVAALEISWIVTIAVRHRSDPGARMPNALVWGMGGTVAALIAYVALELVDVQFSDGVRLALLAALLAATGAWLWRFERLYGGAP